MRAVHFYLVVNFPHFHLLKAAVAAISIHYCMLDELRLRGYILFATQLFTYRFSTNLCTMCTHTHKHTHEVQSANKSQDSFFVYNEIFYPFIQCGALCNVHSPLLNTFNSTSIQHSMVALCTHLYMVQFITILIYFETWI